MNLDLQFYWTLLLRRLPVMLALFLVCAFSATVTALKMPAVYSTSAQLLVEEAQIPDSMLRLEEIDPNQQMQVVQQRLLTRANLLTTARKFNVFENMGSMSPDAIVQNMRSQTIVRRTGGRRGQATLMNISFEARSGQIAANVVNEYVTLILQESTNLRMSRAEGTLTFFEQEVQRLNDDLDLQSAKIIEFKNNNANALPGDLTYRQNRQTLLQERQARLERDIAALVKQRQDMVAVFETTGRVSTPEPEELSVEARQLAQLNFDLQQALSVYSEQNPRIVLLRSRIGQLEKIVQEKAVSGPADSTPNDPPATMFELTLADMDQRAASMREELQNVSVELEKLSASIQATAGNAIALEALERDFNNIQSRYSEAVGNLNRARVTERIEVNAQGQRISVIENANVPREPSGPNRFRMIAMGIMLGGAMAGGFFVLLELLNRAIRRPSELQSRFGIIPLAVIPYLESDRERRMRRAALISAVIAVTIGVPATLWYIDTTYMPLDVLASKIITRLGLT